MNGIPHRLSLLALGGLLSALAWPAMPAQAQPAPTIKPLLAEAQAERIAWWREARVGMFIHWGLYAIPGRGEWVQWSEQIPNSEYAKLAGQFKPRGFSADHWADVAKSAGMKYMVLTARHHDGFALFDDGANRFTSVKSAARRDFVAEYAKAARKAGLKVGLYYSPMDWRFPGYVLPDLQRQSAEEMRAQYHRQMDTLLSRYGKIDVLWFDGGETDWLNFGGEWKTAHWAKRAPGQPYRGGFSYGHEQVYAKLRRLQPEVLINTRADMPPDFHSREGDGALGEYNDKQPWELCTTIAGAWGYQPGVKPKPLAHYIQLLAKVAGRDGNLLLNVGPDRDGRIDELQQQRMGEIGTWLGRYGKSIYGTRGGPFLPGEYGVSTRRGHTIYVHVLDWKADTLVLPSLPAKLVGASVLTGGSVRYTQSERGIELSVPPAERSDVNTVIVLEMDGRVDQFEPVKVDN